jgi:hypothetical protein
MGLDHETATERLLTRLGLWGGMRSGIPLVAALAIAVLLCESLVPPVAGLHPAVRSNVLHLFAIGFGLLLGLTGIYAGEFWDRVVFEATYGARGRWRDAANPPLLVLPPGAPLTRQRALALQALPRHPASDEEGYREAVKIARRQAERWERIEHPLILSRGFRGLLWPCLIAAGLAFPGSVLLSILGGRPEVTRLLATAALSFSLWCLCAAPYARLRVTHMMRLYEDIVRHAPKKKGDRH